VWVFTQASNTFIWFRPVTDHIAEAPDHIELTRITEHRFKGGKVGVNVGNQQTAHKSLNLF
jgi:hypothetical protein